MLKLNHLDYYRLPWNLTDNSISWLEPTAKCNLSCDGCYRKNVKSVKKRNLKPIINTNGLALTKELLHELKKAGVFGFTFHIDSKQGRPGWRNKNELEMNELRLHYAKMLAEEGGISCSFNSTVYEDTMQFIPGMVKWSQEHIDIVQVMVFILYRAVNNEKVDFYLGPKKIDMNQLVYNEETTERTDIIAEEIVELIRKDDPNFDPCAYLNGSEKPDSFKWLLTGRLGRKNKIYGYVGSKGMEIMQTFYHLFNNKYLAYAKPKDAGKGRSMLLLTPFDKRLKKTLFNYVQNPLNIFRKLYYQSVMIPHPFNGAAADDLRMVTGLSVDLVFANQLVWSCRMEEQLNFGHNLKTYPKDFMN